MTFLQIDCEEWCYQQILNNESGVYGCYYLVDNP